ncbi:MAG: TylF/MycF/NovP-related O-methyltransferase, partial [Bacteroidota bacterium]
MLVKILKAIKNLFSYFGIEIGLISHRDQDMITDETFNRIYSKCEKYTMTSKERMFSLYLSVKYVLKNNILGDFVECGVWRGGSTMLIAYTLKELNETNRKIYLYDTFEGMTRPGENDHRLSDNNIKAFTEWKNNQKDLKNNWCYASIEEVKNNMERTEYPIQNFFFIKGKVEDTIPNTMPNKISILRLDTDWYESTKHELNYLYPKLELSGVLIIDDYGYWAGAKMAVDEYFSDKKILLNRIDTT